MVPSSNVTELYNEGSHRCLMFHDLVQGDGVQANQFLVVDGQQAALLEPGGELSCLPLARLLPEVLHGAQLTHLFVSHQDPDVIASLGYWLEHSRSQIVVSRLWSRFLPHLVRSSGPGVQGAVYDRVLAVPDEGMNVPLGGHQLQCVPAHFLHSPGTLHVFDPVSGILFTGDVGSSLEAADSPLPVEHFAGHVPRMIGFHRRCMASKKVCRLWADMIRQMPVQMIVPQHGPPLKGRAIIHQFLDWLSELDCGVDLLGPEDFQPPPGRLSSL